MKKSDGPVANIFMRDYKIISEDVRENFFTLKVGVIGISLIPGEMQVKVLIADGLMNNEYVYTVSEGRWNFKAFLEAAKVSVKFFKQQKKQEAGRVFKKYSEGADARLFD